MEHAPPYRTSRARGKGAPLAWWLLALSSSSACRFPPLQDEPWSHAGPGTHVLAGGAGFGWADFDMRVEGVGGFLDGMVGTDSGDLQPEAGGRIAYQYVVSERFRIGAAAEVRHIEAEPVAPLGIGAILPQLQAQDFTTLHLMLQPRWYSDPLPQAPRWKLFCGADLAWIPDVELDATIVYGGGVFEPTHFDGDDYFTVAPVLGASYLVTDRWTLDFGALYEVSLGDTADDLRLLIVNSDVRSNVTHEGLILFWNLSFHF